MTQILMSISTKKAYSYSININVSLIDHPEKWLPKDWRDKILVIITDNNVNNIYGAKLYSAIESLGSNPVLIAFSPGEHSKNNSTKQYIEEKMLSHGCNRDTLILALGGGVVGDIAGFIASTYMRGIPYIQIPTTSLAMIDSSIGGKTGVNNNYGKNLIGSFWQPKAVIIDLNCLNTLPENHLINGLIEALKIFITHDPVSLEYISNNSDLILNKDKNTLEKIIQAAIKIKINIVQSDEYENNQRMVLNFGHTIGHAIEKVLNYEILHGYAVAMGILIESKISQLLNILPDEDYNVIKKSLLKFNIAVNQYKYFNQTIIDQIITATKSDKKSLRENHQNKTRYILLKKIGEIILSDSNSVAHPVSDDIVKQAFYTVFEE